MRAARTFWPQTDHWALYAAVAGALALAALAPALLARAAPGAHSQDAPLPPLAREFGFIQLAWSQDLPRSLLAMNRATALAQEPTLFHPWWLALGLLRYPLRGLPPDAAWAAFGVALAALAVVAVRFCLRTALPHGGARAAALTLLALCGGWRWWHFAAAELGLAETPVYYREYWTSALAALKNGSVFGSPIVDTWVAPDRLAALAAQAVFLACVSRALLLTAPRAALASWLGAGLALAALQPLMPGSHLLGRLAAGLAVIAAWGSPDEPPARRLRHLLGLALVLAVAWPVHQWYVTIPRVEPAWAHLWTRDERLLPAHPIHVLMALGSIAAGGLAWGVGRAAGSPTALPAPVATLMLGWAALAIWLPTSGFASTGGPLDAAILAALPLAILAADLLVVGLRGVLSARAARVATALAIVSNLPGLYYYGRAAIGETLEPAVVLTREDAGVLAELSRRGGPGDVTLSSDELLDRAVLALTDTRVVNGWLTELRGHYASLRREYFAPSTSPQRQAELLEALGVRFVLYRPGEVAPSSPAHPLRPVASSSTLALLEVERPEAPLPRLGAGDLLRDPSGTIYVFDGRRRRWVPDIETFQAHGYRWERVQAVSGWQLAAIPEGYPVRKPPP